jgi:hypothetical protein
MRLINKKEKLLKVIKIANSKSGRCLSTEYIDEITLMDFICFNNHNFKSSWKNIVYRNNWCKKCSIVNRLSVCTINDQYKEKYIECISTDYIDNKHILDWKCLKCDFIFKSSKNSIDKDFTSCKNCKKKDAFIKVMQCIDQRSCKLLDYNHSELRSKLKLKCECKNKHQFTISYSDLVNIGHWCKYCSSNNYISEEICRAYFESLFQEEFIKIRPKFLRKDNDYCLELDGYCEKLSIAFEHNGVQHYDDVCFGRHMSENKKNDIIKNELCLINNIKLITIPILFKTIMVPNLRNFILEKCANLNITVPYPNASIDLSKCYDNDTFDIYKNIAKQKGGRCVSKYYFGCSTEKLIWECSEKHQWKQFAYVIKKGHWCPVCAGQNHSKNIIRDIVRK